MLRSGQRTVRAIVLVFSAVETAQPAKRPCQTEDVAIVEVRELFSGLQAIDGNYPVITLISKNMVIYPSVWRIMHYSCNPQFYK